MKVETIKQGDITLFTLTNASGASVTLSTLGAAIVAIRVPDKDGKLDDVVLGCPSTMAPTAATAATDSRTRYGTDASSATAYASTTPRPTARKASPDRWR